MKEWLAQWAPWIFGISLVMSVAGIVGAAWAVGHLPADALVRACRRAELDPQTLRAQRRGHLGRSALWLLRNLVGGLFVALGIAMLFLPGQGVLTIALGLGLADFPGRRRLLARVLGNPRVVHGLNRLRARGGHEPFADPHSDPAEPGKSPTRAPQD